MLTAHRRFVDQQKGYYVGLITFCSLLILLIFLQSLIYFGILNLERKMEQREKYMEQGEELGQQNSKNFIA